MKTKLALIAIALIAACNDHGPYADEDKSDDQIRKEAAELTEEKLRRTVKLYADAIVKSDDAARKKELEERAKIYARELARKKLNR